MPQSSPNTACFFQIFLSIPIICRILLMVLLAFSSNLSAQNLEQLILSTLARDPSINSLAALARAAESQVKSAKWQRYPTSSITIKSAVSVFQEDASGQEITLNVRQPVWNGGRLQSNIDEANANLALQVLATDEKKIELITNIIKLYVNWWIEHQKRLSWDQGVEIHERFVGQVKRRVNVGVSAKVDLDIAEGRLSSALADRNLALAEEQVAFDELEFLTGSSASYPLELSEETQLPDQGLDFMAYETLLDAAMVNSNVLKQAQARAAQALVQYGSQKARLKPQVYLEASRQIGDLSGANNGPQNRVFFSFTNELAAGFSFKSDRAASLAAYVAALSQVKSEKRNVERTLRSSLTLLASYDERQLALDEARNNSKQVYQSVDRQFSAGRKDWRQLLNSAREMVQADVEWVQSYGQYMVARWQLVLDTHSISFLVESQ